VCPDSARRPPAQTRQELIATRITPTVLFIAGHPPWPPLSGGRRRELELLERLKERYRVEVCAIDKAAAPGTARKLTGGPVPGVAFGPTRANARTVLETSHHSAPAREWIARRLGYGDVALVHCEGYHLRQLVGSPIRVPIVIGTQNVEWQLVAQRLAVSRGEGSVDEREVLFARAAEIEQLRRADAVISVTPADAEALAAVGIDSVVVPDGCDHLASGGGTGSDVDVAMIANFGYVPNRDAAEVLCGAVLPVVRARRPHTSVRVVGNDATTALARVASNAVEVVGRVESVADHLADASVIACPLRIGGGIKVKMLEALHASAAIVCSTIASQGLEGHGGALVVEDNWQRFAYAICDLLDDPDRLAAQRAAAARFSITLPRWDDAARMADAVWQEVQGVVVDGQAA
jgi:polysaccharide biosynthesis protein PslH